MSSKDSTGLTVFPQEHWGKFPVVLFEPEIPLNVGSIARTCAGTGNLLHLVGRLGFHPDNRLAKRAGLDYWEHVDVTIHKTWDEFTCSSPETRRWLFSTKGSIPFWDVEYQPGDFLVFGSERSGLPGGLLEAESGNVATIPMVEGIRSLNLANCVSIVLYEAIRQQHMK